MRFAAVQALSILLSPLALLAQFRLDDWSQPLTPTPGGIQKSTLSCNPGAGAKVVEQTNVDENGDGWRKTWSCQGGLTSETNYKAWLVDGSFLSTAIAVLTSQEPMGNIASVDGQFEMGKPVGKWRFSGSTHKETLDLSGGDWAVPSFFSENAPACPGQPLYLEIGKLSNNIKEGNWENVDCTNHAWGWQGVYLHGKKQGVWRRFDKYLNAPATTVHMWQTFVDDLATGPFAVNFPSLWERGTVGLTITGELKDGVLPKSTFDTVPVTPDFFDWTRPPDPKFGKMVGTWRFLGPNGVIYGESALSTGNGHLKIFSPDGILTSEGNVINGLADGIWNFYNSAGLPNGPGIEKAVPYHAGIPGTPVLGPGYNLKISYR
jgi:hypothetical protein